MSVTFRGADLSAPISIGSMGKYSDNTPYLKTEHWREIVEHADTATVVEHDLDGLLVSLSTIQSINDARGGMYGHGIRNLILPYIPGARQDRFNPTGDVTSMLKTVASVINVLDFVNVLVLDPHSEQAGYHINHMVAYPLERVYAHLPHDYLGVITPDKGAKLRSIIAYGAVGAKELKQASKVRDVSTGRLTGFEVESLTPGGHYLVADDICDGGGTFVGLGEKIAEQGATADLFVTHGIFSKGIHELQKYYNTIYTTNSMQLIREVHVKRFDIVTEMENYNV